MQKQDYAGLSRAFDAYFSDVKQLVKETEEFYNKEVYDRKFSFNSDQIIGNETYLGRLELNKNDADCTLPRFYFSKSEYASNFNPYFYLVTTPKHEPIYIGTSIDSTKQKSCSISAMTGGLLPVIEKQEVYNAYLGILVAIKKYGYCEIYTIPTGYENIVIKNCSGEIMPKKEMFTRDFNEQVFRYIRNDSAFLLYCHTSSFNNDCFMEDNGVFYEQKERNDKIWNAVSTFKGMVKNRIIGKFEEKKQEIAENQEITIYYYGDSLVFNFKNKVSVMSKEDCESNKETELEKFITPSAKILCQTGDTVYDKYTAYIAHKVKTDNKPNEQFAREFINKQSDFSSFEQSVIDAFPDCKHIEYQNIYLDEIEHKIKNYSLLNNGAASRIIIDTQKMPDIASIRSVACAIYSLFDLDICSTKTTLCLY